MGWQRVGVTHWVRVAWEEYLLVVDEIATTDGPRYRWRVYSEEDGSPLAGGVEDTAEAARAAAEAEAEEWQRWAADEYEDALVGAVVAAARGI